VRPALSSSALGSAKHRTSSPFTVFIAVLWTPSNSCMPFLHCSTQTAPSAGVAQPLPSPGGSSGPAAPQGTVGPSGCRAHCWLMFYLLSARTLTFISPGLLSGLSSPSLYLHAGLPHPRCRIRHLLFLNFIWLVIAYSSSLSASLCKDFLSSEKSTAPPILVFSAHQFIFCSARTIQQRT